MPTIPAFLLKKLYVKGSLCTTPEGFSLRIKNTLAPGTITAISPVQIDAQSIGLEQISISKGNSNRPAARITPAAPFAFNMNDEATISVAGPTLAVGVHSLIVTVRTKEVGDLRIEVEDEL